MEKMSILMGKLGQQKVANGPGQKKKLVLFGWVCLHEHPPFWQFILPFFPFHAGVLRRTTPYVCNAFQWLWNLSTNLCLFLKFLRSVKKGPPSLNQARTELICYPAISLGLNSDILSILLVYAGNTMSKNQPNLRKTSLNLVLCKNCTSWKWEESKKAYLN